MILVPQSIKRSQRSLSCESILSRTGLDDYNIITDYANSAQVVYILYTVEPLYKDTPEMRTSPLNRTLYAVPRVSEIEGFNCTTIFKLYQEVIPILIVFLVH